MESMTELKKEVKRSTSSSCAQVSAEARAQAPSRLSRESCRGNGGLMIGVVTLPFSIESYRYENAKKALKKLREYCDTVVAIDNTKLSKVAGDLPLQQALGVANELVGQFIKGITETITTASLINIDYADLRAICERRGLAAIGVGEAQDSDRVEVAVRQAIDGQLLDIKDVTKSKGVLVHVTGGADVTPRGGHKGGRARDKVATSKDRIVWGARVEPNMRGSARVMVVLTGVESTFLSQQKSGFQMGPIRVGSRN